MKRRQRICPPGARTLLFVEGGDEERFLAQLIPPSVVFVLPFHGRTEALVDDAAAIAMRDPSYPKIKNVGMVADAEEDPNETVTLANRLFAALGLDPPRHGDQVTVRGERRVGIYCLPDASSTGSLETLLRRATEPRAAACVDGLFECHPSVGRTQAQRDKAWMAAYLAATAGNPRVDLAWQGAIDPTHPAFTGLRTFLAALVGPDLQRS